MSRRSPEQLRAALDAQLEELDELPYEGPDAQLAEACLRAVSRAYDRNAQPRQPVEKAAVRLLLDRLAERAPGKSVEVRVPPYAAVQCVEGQRHTRGTPPNIVETDAETWVRLATGDLAWAEAMSSGRIRASGTRADLSAYLPVG